MSKLIDKAPIIESYNNVGKEHEMEYIFVATTVGQFGGADYPHIQTVSVKVFLSLTEYQKAQLHSDGYEVKKVNIGERTDIVDGDDYI